MQRANGSHTPSLEASRPLWSIFGLTFGTLKSRSVINIIILIAKQFIVVRRFKGERVCWDDFVSFLSRHFSMEKLIAREGNKVDNFKEKWKPFITQDYKINI